MSETQDFPDSSPPDTRARSLLECMDDIPGGDGIPFDPPKLEVTFDPAEFD